MSDSRSEICPPAWFALQTFQNCDFLVFFLTDSWIFWARVKSTKTWSHDIWDVVDSTRDISWILWCLTTTHKSFETVCVTILPSNSIHSDRSGVLSMEDNGSEQKSKMVEYWMKNWSDVRKLIVSLNYGYERFQIPFYVIRECVTASQWLVLFSEVSQKPSKSFEINDFGKIANFVWRYHQCEKLTNYK